jgi:hypothetical protein
MVKHFTSSRVVAIALLIMLMFSISGTFAKADVIELQVEWEQFLPGISGQKIIQTSDGGYLVLGQNASILEGDYSSSFVNYTYLIEKLGSSGEVQWSKTYKVGGLTAKIYDIIQTIDGGFALAGGITSFNGSYGDYYGRALSKFCLIKLDPEGEVSWSQIYDDPEPIGNAAFTGISQTSDQGYVLFGTYDYTAAVTYGKYSPLSILVKTDSQGNSLLQKPTGYGAPTSILKVSPDQEYVILSLYPMSGGGSHSQLIFFASNGALQLRKDYIKESSTDSQIFDAITIDNEGYLLGGYYNFGAGAHLYGWLVKTDTEGNTLWNRTYTNATTIRSLTLAHEGGYILCGISQDGWIAKIDNSGNIETELRTGTGIPYSIIPSRTGGYVCVGTMNESSEASTSQRFWIAKIELTTPTTIETSTPTTSSLSPSPSIPEFPSILSPSSTPLPNLIPSSSPTRQPTLEPTQSAQPTTPPNGTDPYLIIGIVAAVVVAVAIVGLAVYSSKHGKKKTKN